MTSPSETEQTPTAVESFFTKHWQKLLAGAVWLAFLLGYGSYAYVNGLTVDQAVQQLIDVLQSPTGPLIYVFLYAVRPRLFFSAAVLTIMGGAVYGPVWGIVIVIIAGNISAVVAFMVGRFFGGGIIKESENADGLVQTYARRLRQNSFETVLIMRLIFLPYDLVNYLCGFLRIDLKAFVLATIIGNIPGTVSFVLFGASIDISQGISQPDFNPWTFIFSILLVGFSIGVSRYFKRREAQREKGAMSNEQ
jgi:uncharacterized membrane protein YdjX (TVP38/TMEM64 family)